MALNQQENQLSIFPKTSKKKTVATQEYKKTSQFFKIFIDGASRGNPGESGAGVYVIDEEGKIFLSEGFYIGKKTNNQAEYLALLFAAYLTTIHLKNINVQIQLNFVSDSELLVKQMCGNYKVKNHFIARVKNVVDNILKNIPHTFTHTRRKNNTTADALANSGVDKRKKIPEELKKFLLQTHIFSPLP
jgi:ribonuclease HI